jgi:GMP synthase-like glutamine amidotransferase
MKFKKILVLQHIEIEDLENIEEYFDPSNFRFTKIRLYKNEKIPPNLTDFSMMIVLGGPMDTWMEEKYPWLINEKKVIKKFVVDMQKPYLGICLGCQLLGEVLGGKIIKSKKPEIGFFEVLSKKDILEDDIFYDFPNVFNVFQWHNYEVSHIKSQEIKVLAYSENTEFQLFRYKNNAYGMQFHIEIKNDTIEKWSQKKSLTDTLKKIYGKNAVNQLKKEFINKQKDINFLCRSFIYKFSKKIS